MDRRAQKKAASVTTVKDEPAPAPAVVEKAAKKQQPKEEPVAPIPAPSPAPVPVAVVEVALVVVPEAAPKAAAKSASKPVVAAAPKVVEAATPVVVKEVAKPAPASASVKDVNNNATDASDATTPAAAKKKKNKKSATAAAGAADESAGKQVVAEQPVTTLAATEKVAPVAVEEPIVDDGKTREHHQPTICKMCWILPFIWHMTWLVSSTGFITVTKKGKKAAARRDNWSTDWLSNISSKHQTKKHAHPVKHPPQIVHCRSNFHLHILAATTTHSCPIFKLLLLLLFLSWL